MLYKMHRLAYLNIGHYAELTFFEASWVDFCVKGLKI